MFPGRDTLPFQKKQGKKYFLPFFYGTFDKTVFQIILFPAGIYFHFLNIIKAQKNENRQLPGQPASDLSCFARTCAERETAKEPDPDLSIAQIRVLILVARSVPSRLTIKQLGQLLQLSPAATSKLIDRIVRHDMIRRIPSESDRRSYYLELTPRSREMIRHHNRAGKALFDRLLCQVPQEDRETFVRVSRLFNKQLWSLLTQQKAKTPPRKRKPRLSSSIPSSSSGAVQAPQPHTQGR